MFSYKTILHPVRTKISVGTCRFFASLSPCEREEEARSFLEQVKKDLTGASHHAFAFRLGVGDKLFARFDDDGEPAGTAGQPMLSVLEKFDLTNVVVVGTRYFGGVKQGIGGLIRAYRACAEAGVKAAPICKKWLTERALLEVPYDYLGAAIREVEALAGEVLKFEYGQKVTVEITIPSQEKENLSRRLASVSRGKAEARFLG